eukprot:TRINITY_DN3985_c0_g2_i1.p2 TRINITY_DN3985_c0_g2~~TRINITY_DN3985_c0_g2_i1.p2  ORF type:complete len:140 (+),score=59.14 TRINITY_DN3985_c0_g2_i1:67-486(+)
MLRRSLIALERQSAGERMMEAIPFVGAPMAAATNKQTWAELAEFRKTEDPATAAQNAFWDAQTKMWAVRFSRLRQEYQEFQDSPAPSDAVSPLLLGRTVVCAVLAYAVAFYMAAGFGAELPVVGRIVGEERPAPPAPLE